MNDNLQQHLIIAAGIARDGDKFFVARRGPSLKESGRWEFPGGKIDPGESFKGALRREIKEELGVDCRVGEPIGVGHFSAGTVVGFEVEYESKPVRSTDHDEMRWVTADELLDLPLAYADYDLAVAAIRHKVQVDRLNVGSVVRLATGGYFLFGGLLAIALYFAQTFLFGFVPREMVTSVPLVGVGTVILLSGFYAVLGAFAGLFLTLLYNLLAKLFGGVQFEIRRR